MYRRLHFAPEADDVYIALVGELATTLVPATVMGLTFVAIGLFIAISLGSPLLLVATLAGVVLTIVRVGLIIAYRRQSPSTPSNRSRTARWEQALALANLGFAMQLSIVAAATFFASEPSLQMLATGLLFGYCSGIVARTSIRPKLAIAATTVATAPVIAAAAIHGGTAYWILAAIFLIFLVASFESVRHVHAATVRQIAMRIDMATLARNDPLTGLANRLGLREAFRAIRGAHDAPPMIAVHCFDLDGFKPVNDCHGHPAGDMLLMTMADRVRATLRASDIAARIGGDEFVVVQAPIRHPDEAEMFARRLARVITAPYEVDGQPIRIGVSLGFATSPPDICELDALLSAADAALYRMKSGGGGVARGQCGTAAA